MQGQLIWVGNGKMQIASDYRGADTASAMDEMIHRRGFVRLVVGEIGTEICWATLSSCYASLVAAMSWMRAVHGPFMLRYFLSGWFEEFYYSAEDAIRRIEAIAAHSDYHPIQKVIIGEADPLSGQMPQSLHEAWMDGTAEAGNSIDCIYEESSGRFHVERIGEKSTIARIWGTEHNAAHPCASGNNYDKTVSIAYNLVLRTGQPHYDHVIAAMKMPDDMVKWLPYQRIIFPRRARDKKMGVSVVTEIAQVGIRVV